MEEVKERNGSPAAELGTSGRRLLTASARLPRGNVQSAGSTCLPRTWTSSVVTDAGAHHTPRAPRSCRGRPSDSEGQREFPARCQGRVEFVRLNFHRDFFEVAEPTRETAARNNVRKMKGDSIFPVIEVWTPFIFILDIYLSQSNLRAQESGCLVSEITLFSTRKGSWG